MQEEMLPVVAPGGACLGSALVQQDRHAQVPHGYVPSFLWTLVLREKPVIMEIMMMMTQMLAKQAVQAVQQALQPHHQQSLLFILPHLLIRVTCAVRKVYEVNS